MRRKGTGKRMRNAMAYTAMALCFAVSMLLIFPSEKNRPDTPVFSTDMPAPSSGSRIKDRMDAWRETDISMKDEPLSQGDGDADWMRLIAEQAPMETVIADTVTGGRLRNALEGISELSAELETIRSDTVSDDASTQIPKEEEQQPESGAESGIKDEMQAQMELMERSYEMAARLVGQSGTQPQAEEDNEAEPQKDPARKMERPSDSRISSLSAIHAAYEGNAAAPTATVRAELCPGQRLISGGEARIRLLEDMDVDGVRIRCGSDLTASVQVSGNRISMRVTGILTPDGIIPVSISVYSPQGQEGLPVVTSRAAGAISDAGGSMASSAGSSSMMLNADASDIVAENVTRGTMRGLGSLLRESLRGDRLPVPQGMTVLLVNDSDRQHN